MDGRRMGALLLAGVAVAGVVLHGAVGHPTVGTPVAAMVPPAPRPGACVVALSTPPSEGRLARIDYPYARFGSCTGPKIGEVLDIDPAPHEFAGITLDDYQQQSALCELSEVGYVGSIGPFDPATITTPGIGWQAAVTVESLSIAPTPLQRAAGQQWTACVGATGDRSVYTGTLSSALTVGSLPPQFATCWRALVSSTEQQVTEPEVACSRPHSVEILATTQITDPATTPAFVEQSCLGMASRTLRTADPTVGGRLRITAYSMDGSSVLPVDRVNMMAGFTACVASVPAPLRLSGTVIGLGSKPLPLGG